MGSEDGMTLHVRQAVPGDVPAAADLLADAFTDYAWTRWTVDAHRHRERLVDLHRLFLAQVAVPLGRVDVGAVGAELVGVAVWVPAGVVPDEVWARVGPAAARLAGDRAAAAEEAETALAGHRPDGEHVTLASLGVALHHQRRGVGTATLRPGLDRADREGVPVHLETSAESYVRFYRRLGFTVTGVVDLPRGGPRTWLMDRSPVAAPVDGTALGATSNPPGGRARPGPGHRRR